MFIFNITTYLITFLLTWCMLTPHAGLDNPLVDKLCKYHLLNLYIEIYVGKILREFNCWWQDALEIQCYMQLGDELCCCIQLEWTEVAVLVKVPSCEREHWRRLSDLSVTVWELICLTETFVIYLEASYTSFKTKPPVRGRFPTPTQPNKN